MTDWRNELRRGSSLTARKRRGANLVALTIRFFFPLNLGASNRFFIFFVVVIVTIVVVRIIALYTIVIVTVFFSCFKASLASLSILFHYILES